MDGGGAGASSFVLSLSVERTSRPPRDPTLGSWRDHPLLGTSDGRTLSYSLNRSGGTDLDYRPSYLRASPTPRVHWNV